MRRLIFFWIITIIGMPFSFSQKPENLLIVSFQDKEYFAPVILDCLNNLKFSNDNKTIKAFDKILVLNQLQRHIIEQANIKNLIDYFKQNAKYIDLDKGTKRLYDSISKYLGDYNSFLEINTNQINNLIEVQFSLYTNILKGGKNYFTSKDPRYPDKYQSVVFIPQENNYSRLLEKGVKKLFPEFSIKPECRIFVNDKHNINGKAFLFATSDTITLDGSFSTDNDSNREDLTYAWKEIDTLSQLSSLPLDINRPHISFLLNQPGEYIFGLTVFDGISYSTEDTVKIKVIVKPRIFISENDRNKVFVNQKSGRLIRKKKKLYKYDIDVITSDYHPNKLNLIVQDLNEDLYYKTTDTLQVLQWYLWQDSIPPSHILLHRQFDYFERSFRVDSVTANKHSYRVFFSGDPTSSTYSFRIYEKYNELFSNACIVNFKTNFLSQVKFGFEFQNISLSSHKNFNWRNVNLSSPDTNSYIYSYKYYFPYISYYLSTRLALDYNLEQLATIFNSSLLPKYYIPMLRVRYEFFDQDRYTLSPFITLGEIDFNKGTGSSAFGFGFMTNFNYKNVIFYSFGKELIYGNGFNGGTFILSLRLDIMKIISKYREK